MDKRAKHIRVSEQCLTGLSKIVERYDLGSLSSALEFLVQDYVLLVEEHEKVTERLAAIEKTITLNKKYLNEIRRDNFLMLDLLNAICLEKNIPFCPSHLNKDFRARALQLAHENLDSHLQDVFTKNKNKGV